jgi:hypothetical protein
LATFSVHLEDLGIKGNKILKCTLKKQGVRLRTDLMWPVAGACEHSNEPLGSIKDGKILDQLIHY